VRATAALVVPSLLLLAPLRVQRRRTLGPLPLAIDDRSKVQEAHDSSDHRVRDDIAAFRASELQPKTAVDHSEDDGSAADADVRVGHGRAAAVLLESAVVQHAAEGLRDEEDEQHDADDGVGASEVLAVDSDPDADAEGDDVDQESEDLHGGVYPYEAGEAGDADKNAPDREEDEECKRSHHGVGEKHSLGRAGRGAVTAVLR